jgi:glycine cleavage system H protein
MKFTETHEWVSFDPATHIATVGVTQHAQKELGEVVYVELPQVGKEVKAGAEAAVLESTKAAADVYAPLSGSIAEVNIRLRSAAELINRSPEKEGWIFKLTVSNPKELDALLDAQGYESMIKS